MAPQRSLVCESCVAGIDEACARRANFRRGAANGYSVLADMVSDDEEQAGTEGASSTECEDGDGASAADELKTFDVYPLSEREPLEQTGRDVRVLHIVRHAEGTHNVNRAYREIENLDARLTPLGEEQCLRLSDRRRKLPPVYVAFGIDPFQRMRAPSGAHSWSSSWRR